MLFSLQLIFFHAWLGRRGLTTFEFIQYRRELFEKKKDVKEGKMTLEQLAEWKKEGLKNFKPTKKSRTINRKTDIKE